MSVQLLCVFLQRLYLMMIPFGLDGGIQDTFAYWINFRKCEKNNLLKWKPIQSKNLFKAEWPRSPWKIVMYATFPIRNMSRKEIEGNIYSLMAVKPVGKGKFPSNKNKNKIHKMYMNVMFNVTEFYLFPLFTSQFMHLQINFSKYM